MIKAWVIALSAVLLSGCSLLEDVNSTLQYVNEATEYAAEADSFINEVPELAEQAVIDPAVISNLEERLVLMKEDINEFNELEAPGVATDLHRQVEEYNAQALEGIDTILGALDQGVIDPAFLEETEVFRTFQEIQSIINQVEQLTAG